MNSGDGCRNQEGHSEYGAGTDTVCHDSRVAAVGSAEYDPVLSDHEVQMGQAQ